MTEIVLDSVSDSARTASVRSCCATAALAALLGAGSGLACAAVRLAFRALQWVFTRQTGLLPDAAAHLPPLARTLVPVAGSLAATLVLVVARQWSRSDTFIEYVDAIRHDGGRIPFGSTAWRTVSSAFSVASGAAVGREGSMIQFAAAVTSWAGARLGIDRVTLGRKVSYGAAAAVAAAYQAPVAGMFFALEIVLGEWVWREALPLACAAFAGWAASHAVLGGGPLFPAQGRLRVHALLWLPVLAVALGAAGPAYQGLIRSLTRLRRLPMPLALAGAVVGGLSLVHPAVWGNGDV